MKFFLALLITLSCSVLHATSIQVLDDVLNPEKATDNEAALNDNFDAFWVSKIDISTSAKNLIGKRYVVYDLLNPGLAEQNAAALNGNYLDLWQAKQDVSGVPGYQRFLVTAEMLKDRSRSEELTAMLMQNFYDIEQSKEDR